MPASAGELPAILELLLDSMTEKVERTTRKLQQSSSSSSSDVDAWEAAMQDLLARYSLAAMMAGSGQEDLSKEQFGAVENAVAAQLDFLRNFAVEVQAAEAFKDGWLARAKMYAQSIKNPYWRGATHMLPLPAMPGDGTTQCRVNCKCSWEIVEVEADQDAEDYDCYWRLGASEHCQSCRVRAATWSPIRIRGGSLE